MSGLKYALTNIKIYLKAFVKWLGISLIVGIAGGVIGGAFHLFVGYATNIREAHPYMIYFLPAAGIVIAFLYSISGLKKDPGTNIVITAVRENKKVPFAMSPLIFASTVITHLFGGSAGREGAALQLGGSISYSVGKLLKLDEKDMHAVILCGMSAVFSALFNTPVTAAVFAIEVISVGIVYYSSLLPCVIASYTACLISIMMGNHAPAYTIAAVPDFCVSNLIKITIVAILCGVFSIVICVTMKRTHMLLKKVFPNIYVRAAAGGAVIVLLTLCVGNHDYNGAGMDVVQKAINGQAVWYAFLLKLLFTAITIGSGFKGGEIVPTFFMGATLGCTLGSIVGLDPGFCAAVGLISTFCGAVNCPIAAVVLSVEMFGAKGFALFAAASAASYMMSGNFGLYSSQKIMYSKVKNEYIDVNTK